MICFRRTMTATLMGQKFPVTIPECWSLPLPQIQHNLQPRNVLPPTILSSDMATRQVASDVILKMYNYRYHHDGRNNLLRSPYCVWPQFYEWHATLIRLVVFFLVEHNKIAAAIKKILCSRFVSDNPLAVSDVQFYRHVDNKCNNTCYIKKTAWK
jgi:hypothetical protein